MNYFEQLYFLVFLKGIFLNQHITTLIMKKLLFTLLSVFCGLTAIADTGATPPENLFAQPDRIRYDGSCMTIDGEDIFVYSAAFHYFRCPRELWRDRFQKIKEAGFNTVETYVPWNQHEQSLPSGLDDTSKFNFDEIKEWLRMAQDEFGLYTIVRPGPFICAEYSGGAYPRWLAKFRPEKYEGFWLRSADPEHVRWCVHWFDAVCKALAGEQITQKKKGEKGIVMIQIENEYNAHGCDNKEEFLKELFRSVRRSGMDIPVFTCLTSQCRGSKDSELSQVFDCENCYVGGLGEAPNCAHRMVSLRQEQPNAPAFVTELQGGWFSLVTGGLSDNHFSDDRHFRALGLMTILGGGTGINYYMFFGGTHFAGWGARGMTTTYDYNAAIHESGALGTKYFAACEIGELIKAHGKQLARAEGGPCLLKEAPKSLFGGIRVATDGTQFVFLHNTDAEQPQKGTVTIVPGKVSKPTTPIYNVNQHGEKVLVKTGEVKEDEKVTLPPVDVTYDLPALGTKVLVIPPGKTPAEGDWWPKVQQKPARPAQLPEPIRIATAQRMEDAFDQAKWQDLPELTSLSDLDVHDFRYSLYRARFELTQEQADKERFLLFNMYTRDIVSVLVNGKPVPRLFPDSADAQSWTTRDCDKRIRDDEFDNRFDVSGLLKKGGNDITVVYENLGHAHGYVPMEELAGIRRAGLSDKENALTHPLKWECSLDTAGVTNGWIKPDFLAKNGTMVNLNTSGEIPRKGNNTQPKSKQDGLFTWYRVEFELPESDPSVWIPWLARVNASGNGYMWLNGHNIGRHWEAGPQREFYLPECWLNFGKKKNVIVFGLRQTANGALLESMEISPYPDSAVIIDQPKKKQ